ncbi:ATP-binding cassette domain-containing protein [Rhodoferax sp.]|uniref:ABC transporter ATP-binding protein n=1 Tax=Rhodoferax sp. TaxID=50421 RepID=UPI002849CC09|nr:ATP-binding cassette domain-containing protein [Rhodoferax sp.]MDR3369765.1 ATP-binding cassette domain-containing protein [Rhodoferax sp.]
MNPIEAYELYRFYHSSDVETAALRGVSLQVKAGEFVAIMGPSGSGKSTLLSCLAGLDEPDGGHVEVMGERMSRRSESARARLRAQHVGILMQSGNLFEHLTLGGNIELQMRLSNVYDAAGIDPLLSQVGLDQKRHAYASQLSGGEVARGGLAVALSARPQVLLADEPTAEVDSDTENSIMHQLLQRRQEGMAMLIFTHSKSLASQADRLLTLRDGRLQHV